MVVASIDVTTVPCWFFASMKVCTKPRSGFVRERRASRTVTRIDSASPERTGASQRTSSMPGEARLATDDR